MIKRLLITLLLFCGQACWVEADIFPELVRPGSIWSLFVAPKENENDVKKLVTVFADYYGFAPDKTQIVFIPGDSEIDKEEKEKSRVPEKIENAMNSLYEQVRPDDSLFVYIHGLETHESEGRTVFSYLGHNRYSVFPVDSWLKAIESRTKFLIFQYCQTLGIRQEPGIFEPWRLGEFDRSISAMLYCDSEKNTGKFLLSLISTLELLVREKVSSDKETTSEFPAKGIYREVVELEYLNYRLKTEYQGQRSTFLQYPSGAYQYFVLPLVVSDIAALKARFNRAVTQKSIIAQMRVIDEFGYEARYRSREKISVSHIESFLVDDVGLREDISLKVKGLAIQILSELRADAGLRKLIEKSKNSLVRRTAIRELSPYYSDENSDLLRKVAVQTDEDTSARVTAIQALYRQNPKGLGSIIEQLLHDKNIEVSVVAIQILAGYSPTKKFRDYLVETLKKDGDPENRSAAAITLQSYTDFAGIDTSLLEQLRIEESVWVREAIVYALGRTTKSENKDAVGEQLKRELDRGPDDVRIAAVWSLGEIGGENAGKVLLRLLKDSKRIDKIRVTAAESLGRLRDEKTVRMLVKVAKNRSEPAVVRNACLSALSKLGKLGGEIALAALYDSLKDEDNSIRMTARKSLGEIEVSTKKFDEKIDRLLEDQSTLVRLEAVRELSKRNDPSTVPLLVQLLNDSEYKVRQAAIDVLSRFQDEESVKTVAEVLRNKQNATARYSAVQVIRANPGRRATRILFNHRQDTDSSVRAQIVSALGGRDDELAQQAFFEAAEDRDALVRAAAAEALKLSDDPEAKRVLLKLSQDPSQFVRRVVIEGNTVWKK